MFIKHPVNTEYNYVQRLFKQGHTITLTSNSNKKNINEKINYLTINTNYVTKICFQNLQAEFTDRIASITSASQRMQENTVLNMPDDDD